MNFVESISFVLFLAVVIVGLGLGLYLLGYDSDLHQ
jgi:hypothetical protein